MSGMAACWSRRAELELNWNLTPISPNFPESLNHVAAILSYKVKRFIGLMPLNR